MSTQLQEALAEQIKDLYSAEMQLTKALPKMAKAADSPSLKEAILKHLKQTEVHVERIQKAAQMLEIKPSGKKCKAMEGLIAEGKETLDEHDAGALRDALIIAAAQRVEHYEIAAYGTVRAMAEKLEDMRLAELLQTTLDEEKAADEKLTEISEGEVLPEAAQCEDDEEEAEAPSRSRSKSR
ncbi:MAG: ferritin-like domain-containing protein [Phycisphaerales bacterium]